jgi:hypothetical protein
VTHFVGVAFVDVSNAVVSANAGHLHRVGTFGWARFAGATGVIKRDLFACVVTKRVISTRDIRIPATGLAELRVAHKDGRLGAFTRRRRRGASQKSEHRNQQKNSLHKNLQYSSLTSFRRSGFTFSVDVVVVHDDLGSEF